MSNFINFQILNVTISNTYTRSEILGLVLENLAVVLSCNQKFTSSVQSKVTPLTIAIFLQYNSDPVITSVSQDIFKVSTGE